MALVLLCAAVYLPGLMTLPAVDRDEARFAQASRQMFESVALPEAERDPGHHAGGLVVPMLQGRPRLNKPPLIYWLQASSAAVFTGGDPGRDAVWMYRVPSTLAAVASVLMLWRLGLSMFDPRAAFLAAMMLAVCPLFVWEARQARADHVLTACTIGAMWGLWGVWRGGVETQRHREHRKVRGDGHRVRGAAPGSTQGDNLVRMGRGVPAQRERSDQPGCPGDPHRTPLHRLDARTTEPSPPSPDGLESPSPSNSQSPWGSAFLLWLAMALGVMTKGPITPMVVLLAAVSLSLLTRRWRWMCGSRLALGAAILAAAIVPWIVLLTERYGLTRYLALVYDETFGRATTAREKHWGPPGYHLVLLIVMLWPGSMVTGMAVIRGWRRTVAGWRPWTWRARAGASGALGVRSRSADLFCLAWVVPSWVVFEVSATKLPHYVMPLFPALALLSARTLLAASAGSVPGAFGRLATGVYVLWLGVCAIGGVGILAASLLVFDGSWRGPMLVAAGCAGTALLVQVWLLVRACGAVVRRKPARAMRAGLAMAVVLWVAAIGIAVPRAPSLWVSSGAARALRAIDPHGQRAVGLLFREDSMIFETRGRGVRLRGVEELAGFLEQNPEGLVVMRQSDLEGRGDVRVLAFVAGFNVAATRRERLAIVEAAGRDGPIGTEGAGP